MNPNAVIGTGNGGPGNIYPSYLAAGTLVPVVFNGISEAISQTPDPYTGMQQVTYDNPYLPLDKGIYQVPRFFPGYPDRFAGRLRKRKDAIRGGLGRTCGRQPTRARLAWRRPGYLSLRQDSAPLPSRDQPLAGYTQDALPAANQIVGLSVPSATVVSSGPEI